MLFWCKTPTLSLFSLPFKLLASIISISCTGWRRLEGKDSYEAWRKCSKIPLHRWFPGSHCSWVGHAQCMSTWVHTSFFSLFSICLLFFVQFLLQNLTSFNFHFISASNCTSCACWTNCQAQVSFFIANLMLVWEFFWY